MVMHYQNRHRRRDMANNSRKYESIERETRMLAAGMSGIFKYNSIYGPTVLNDSMLGASLRSTSVGGYLEGRRSILTMYDMPAPSDEWFRYLMGTADLDFIHEFISNSLLYQFEHLIELDRLPKEGITVAADMHKIPRHDRKPGPELMRGKYKNGATYFEAYITIHCVVAGIRLVLAVLPMHAGDTVAEFVPKIMELCMNVPKISLIMMDSGFFSAETISYLREIDIPYLIPCRNTSGVVERLRDFAKDGKSISEMVITSQSQSVPYTMVIVKREKKKKKKNHEELEPGEEFIGFATNRPSIDVKKYAKRWGIETAYAKIEAMRTKTRSKSVDSRFFCFGYSLIIYNAWVLANLLFAILSMISAEKPNISQDTFKSGVAAILLRQPPEPPPEPVAP